MTLVSQTVFVFRSERGAANTLSIIFQFCGKLTTLLQSFENTTLELNEFLQKVILNNSSFSLFLGCRVFCQVTYSASEKVNFRCIFFVEIKTKLTIWTSSIEGHCWSNQPDSIKNFIWITNTENNFHPQVKLKKEQVIPVIKYRQFFGIFHQILGWARGTH